MRKSEKRILTRAIDRTLVRFKGDATTQNQCFRSLYQRLVKSGEIKPTKTGVKKCKTIFQGLKNIVEDLGDIIAMVYSIDENDISVMKEKCLRYLRGAS